MKLHLIPTPIGNLEDLTYRAVRILKEMDLVLAEDTRQSRKLFQHYGIETPLKSYHTHNEHGKTDWVIGQIKWGDKVALISDAGTPGISDPGFLLVRSCLAEGIEVECLPGSTALIPALVASGFPCDRFVFEGFLPQKKGRKTKLETLAKETRTIVLYESPHRINKLIYQIELHFGAGRKFCIARELSKLHEEFLRGTAQEIKTKIGERKLKGEIVVVIEGFSKQGLSNKHPKHFKNPKNPGNYNS